MFGAVVGDVVGSRFEWHNIKTKDFELITPKSKFTDDTVMTIAVADALAKSKPNNYSDLSDCAIERMQYWGRKYHGAGYGRSFYSWIFSGSPVPYNSFGNGAAMRVSACGYASRSINDAKQLSFAVTSVTHDHPESIKAAEAVSSAVYMARTGSDMDAIRAYITENYYNIDFTLDEIRPSYRFNVSCQGSVPQAFEAFFESNGFIDAIRNAVSIGGDSDTIAAIAGSIAWAYYSRGGVTDEMASIRDTVLDILPSDLKETLINTSKILTK